MDGWSSPSLNPFCFLFSGDLALTEPVALDERTRTWQQCWQQNRQTIANNHTPQRTTNQGKKHAEDTGKRQQTSPGESPLRHPMKTLFPIPNTFVASFTSWINGSNSGSNAKEFRRLETNTDELRIRYLSALDFFKVGQERVKNRDTGSSTLPHRVSLHSGNILLLFHEKNSAGHAIFKYDPGAFSLLRSAF